MHLLSNPIAVERAFIANIKICDQVTIAAAWASIGFKGFDALKDNSSKIKKAIIGTHFYQTHPKFISTFLKHKNVRFVFEPSGVFHPKLYLFEGPRQSWNCIIGSANFTSGGFKSNKEVCLLIDQDDINSKKLLSDLHGTISDFWKLGENLDQDDLNKYTTTWKLRQSHLMSVSGTYGGRTKSVAPHNVKLLTMSWANYVDDVKNDQHHSVEGRVKVLQESRNLFSEFIHFNKIPRDKRKGIAGFASEKDVPWGWFGGMKGAGVFKQVVNRNNPNLSAALDNIPLNGAVLKEHYTLYISTYIKAFPVDGSGKHTRHGLATATRLLAMKRPDYFVCVDNANRSGINEAFGISLQIHDYDKYWDEVVERLKDANWWNSHRPQNAADAAVWDGRTAFLDAIFYVPK